MSTHFFSILPFSCVSTSSAAVGLSGSLRGDTPPLSPAMDCVLFPSDLWSVEELGDSVS